MPKGNTRLLTARDVPGTSAMARTIVQKGRGGGAGDMSAYQKLSLLLRGRQVEGQDTRFQQGEERR